MPFENTFIASTGSALGEVVSVQEAVARGEYPADLAEDDGYVSTCVSQDVPAVELAVEASRMALRSAALGESPDLVLHSCVGYQGYDDFASAAYLHHHVAGGRGAPIEVRQASNGGMAALEVAAAFIRASESPSTALVSTSDVFSPPITDRYGTPGTLYGDAGTALVLTNKPAWLQLLSIVSIADTTHEPLQRAGVDWCTHPGQLGWPVDVAGRIAAYVQSHGPDTMLDLVERIQAAERLTIERALEQAGVTADAIDHWVFPNMGLTLTDWSVREDYGVVLDRVTWEWGRTVGHLGAGDQFAALDHLGPRLEQGQYVLLHGAGTGFTFSSAVVRVTGSSSHGRPVWE